MSLSAPNLDDRDFESLCQDSLAVIRASCPEWTDLSPGDPGIALVEVFAHLTETMLYRLNRVPEKVYIQLLRLLGVQRRTSRAARTTLRFSVALPSSKPLLIPQGTRVVSGESGAGRPAVFSTLSPLTIPAGELSGEVEAWNAERVELEDHGRADGRPGGVMTALRHPFVASHSADQDVLVAVEVDPKELDERVPSLEHDGSSFRIWREVDDFVSANGDDCVFTVDRFSGQIRFAPSLRRSVALDELTSRATTAAALPRTGRRVLLSYSFGGGEEGNLEPGVLNTMVDPVAGVTVTNVTAATGGRDAETLENVLLRGPMEFRSPEQALTASDFERLAMRASGNVGRAKALTAASLWRHASPGAVEVVLVPFVAESDRLNGQVTLEQILQRQRDEDLLRIASDLEGRRALGTSSHVRWAEYKRITIKARIVCYRGADQRGVERSILERLHRTLCPLASPGHPGWNFGRALRPFTVFDVVRAEPGVKYADRIEMIVDEAPADGVALVASDSSQPGTWFAAAEDGLFRSLNDGSGWERCATDLQQQATVLEIHPSKPGALAIVTNADDGSIVQASRDCGESWTTFAKTSFDVTSVAWTEIDGVDSLLVGSTKGLFLLALEPGSSPIPIEVAPDDHDLGFSRVVAISSPRGGVLVAVAAHQTRGVYLSHGGGRSGSFKHVGLSDKVVETLRLRRRGPEVEVWAGMTADGNTGGTGVSSLRLRGDDLAPQAWIDHIVGWRGGSCRSLAFVHDAVLASTHGAGVLRLELAGEHRTWESVDVACGLPLREPGRMHPVLALAASGSGTLLACGERGLFRARYNGDRWREEGGWRPVGQHRFTESDHVTLPDTYLLVSGEHELELLSEEQLSND